MGLDTTHGCWHGAYSRFDRFRAELVRAAWGFSMHTLPGLAPLGSGPEWKPTNAFPEGDPLTVLINHSDCDGEIAWQDAGPLADRLMELLPMVSDEWRQATLNFACGLQTACARHENVGFH